MQLSVIIPVYNEQNTILEIIKRVQDTRLAQEIIIIDDGSIDATREKLLQLEGQNGIRVILHPNNMGKGSAVRTGIMAVTGDVVIIQDADLEYDPREYPSLLKPIEEGVADVVYGSRFLSAPHSAILFWNMVANKIVTFFTNLLFNTIISDTETGYKVFKRSIIQDITLTCKGFEFDPEITAKILKRNVRIFEVPISFNPRDYTQGKKINTWDGILAIWTLFKFRFFD